MSLIKELFGVLSWLLHSKIIVVIGFPIVRVKQREFVNNNQV